jgi:transketolase
MADHGGVVYMRTTREATPVIYSPDEQFSIGGSKVLRRSDNDQVTVVAAGVTLHEALKAYDLLKSEGVTIRVIDAYSVKPIDEETLLAAAEETGEKIVVVEDHWIEGGLGDAVLDVFTKRDGPLPEVVKLAVNNMPGSDTPEQLLEAAGISADSIVRAVLALVHGPGTHQAQAGLQEGK